MRLTLTDGKRKTENFQLFLLLDKRNYQNIISMTQIRINEGNTIGKNYNREFVAVNNFKYNSI